MIMNADKSHFAILEPSLTHYFTAPAADTLTVSLHLQFLAYCTSSPPNIKQLSYFLHDMLSLPLKIQTINFSTPYVLLNILFLPVYF